MPATTGLSDKKTNLAIFASGSGSNAENIIQYFQSTSVETKIIFCNRKGAGIFERAKKYQIEAKLLDRHNFFSGNFYVDLLLDTKIDWIILAGFLWLVPANLINAFPNRIINIHPALLPKYGGKGMYGSHVHKAVSKNGDGTSGITIHYVNEKYDDGQIIFQKSRPIIPGEDPEVIAQKVLEIEHKYYPKVIESLILGKEVM